jgi:hypothetical protein
MKPVFIRVNWRIADKQAALLWSKARRAGGVRKRVAFIPPVWCNNIVKKNHRDHRENSNNQ